MNSCNNCNAKMNDEEYEITDGICDFCFSQMPMDTWVSNWPVIKTKENNE